MKNKIYALSLAALRFTWYEAMEEEEGAGGTVGWGSLNLDNNELRMQLSASEVLGSVTHHQASRERPICKTTLNSGHKSCSRQLDAWSLMVWLSMSRMK